MGAAGQAAAKALIVAVLGMGPALSGCGNGGASRGTGGAGVAKGGDAGGGAAGRPQGGGAGSGPQGGAAGGTAGIAGGGAATGGAVVSSGGTAGARDTGGAGGQTCGPAVPSYTFTREKIRSLPSGMFTAGIVVQSDGAPLFLYADETPGKGQVWATRRPQTDDGGVSVALSYQITRPHTGGRMAGLPAIRIAQNGEIRIAYQEQYNGGWIRYVTWSGDFNQTPDDVVVGSDAPNVTILPRIGFDLDGQDRPAILYALTNQAVRYASNTGGSWQVEDVATKSIDELAVAFTGSATPAAFLAVPNVQSSDDVYVSSRGSSAWGAPALLDPQSSQGAHLWAGHDGTGQVQLFYTGASGPRRIVGAPGAWNLAASTPAVAGSNSYVSVAVAFGPGGVIHAVYGGIGVGVVYAAFDGCAWSTQIVDADTGMGGYLAIALDSSGRPQVAYQAAQLPTTTQPDSDLWYAHPAP